MVVGEGRAFLSALVVLNPPRWRAAAAELGLDAGEPGDDAAPASAEEFLCARIADATRDFPGYAQVRRVRATLAPWTTENGLLTPTLKIKRAALREKFAADLARFYAD